jgi:hypothetical protein
MDAIIADVEQKLIYTPNHTGNAPKTQQNTTAFWSLFTPNINTRIDNHDIITTSAAVKKEFARHPTLFHLSSWAQDIVITYIVFEMFA